MSFFIASSISFRSASGFRSYFHFVVLHAWFSFPHCCCVVFLPFTPSQNKYNAKTARSIEYIKRDAYDGGGSTPSITLLVHSRRILLNTLFHNRSLHWDIAPFYPTLLAIRWVGGWVDISLSLFHTHMFFRCPPSISSSPYLMFPDGTLLLFTPSVKYFGTVHSPMFGTQSLKNVLQEFESLPAGRNILRRTFSVDRSGDISTTTNIPRV